MRTWSSRRARCAPQRGAGRARVRRGMTLVEVLVALTILTGAMLGMAAFISRFAHEVSVSRMRITMLQLANDRIEKAKVTFPYGAIDTLAASEPSVAGHTAFQRSTLVKHVGGGIADTVDYRVVTVIVTAPTMVDSVKKSTIISNF